MRWQAAGGFSLWITLVIGTLTGGITELQFDGHDLSCELKLTDHWWYSPNKQEIVEIQCSPNNKWIAAATSSGGIEIFDGTQRGFVHIWRVSHSTRVKTLDFSVDSNVLQSADTAGELLLWAIESKTQVSAFDMRDEPFETWTSMRGWSVSGMWPEGATLNDVRSCGRSRSHKLLVTGDKNGLVKMFNYPCVTPQSAFKTYRCHATFIEGVKFSYDDEYVISSGGLRDCSIALWRVEYCKCEKCEKRASSPSRRGRRRSKFVSKVNTAMFRKKTDEHQAEANGTEVSFASTIMEAVHEKKQEENNSLVEEVLASRNEERSLAREVVVSSKPVAKR